ncbi:MAG: hypothetical protein WBD61_05840 [Desulfobulbales bacterium]|jgi:hypothetical protein
MEKKNLWMVIIIVAGFLGYMMGYSVPPFLEVGFGDNIDLLEEGAPLPDDILKQYEHLYEDEEEE